MRDLQPGADHRRVTESQKQTEVADGPQPTLLRLGTHHVCFGMRWWKGKRCGSDTLRHGVVL